MRIYAISGLGTGANAFCNLKLEPDHTLVVIPWIVPIKNETTRSYALRMSEEIDTSEDFVLLGVSFGGMIVQELAEFLQPQAVILISTVTNRKELSGFFLFLSYSKVYKLLPVHFFTSKKKFSYYYLRQLYNKNLPNYDKYFEMMDHTYLKWAIDKCIQWEGNKRLPQSLRLHGNLDIVFPVSKVHDAEIINKGTHVMILTKANSISNKIKNFLQYV